MAEQSVRKYWQRRYARGGNSGPGSRGRQAQRKADYVNELVKRERIGSIIDWGSGDGVVAALLRCQSYLGLDPSPHAVKLARKRNPDKRFAVLGDNEGEADLAMSLDVVFHLLDDAEFTAHLGCLFVSARRFVLIHGTDYEAPAENHVRRRAFTHLAPEPWVLIDRPDDPTVNGPYLYSRGVA